MRFGKPCPDCERLRADLARAERLLEQARTDLLTTITEERDRYGALVHETFALRRAGFNPPEPLQAEYVPDQLSPEIDEAIAARSFDTNSRRHLERYAKRQARLNVDPEKIATAIWDGETGDTG